jgi:hypothetical protein
VLRTLIRTLDFVEVPSNFVTVALIVVVFFCFRCFSCFFSFVFLCAYYIIADDASSSSSSFLFLSISSYVNASFLATSCIVYLFFFLSWTYWNYKNKTKEKKIEKSSLFKIIFDNRSVESMNSAMICGKLRFKRCQCFFISISKALISVIQQVFWSKNSKVHFIFDSESSSAYSTNI